MALEHCIMQTQFAVAFVGCDEWLVMFGCGVVVDRDRRCFDVADDADGDCDKLVSDCCLLLQCIDEVDLDVCRRCL